MNYSHIENLTLSRNPSYFFF